MSRPTLFELAQSQAEAALHYPIGSYIRHQKGDNIYEVMFYSTREADGEILMTFRPIAYDNHLRTTRMGQLEADERDCLITRPLSEISERVDIGRDGGVQIVPRFVRAAKVETWIDV